MINQTSLKFIWEEYYINLKSLKQIKKDDGDLMSSGIIDQVINRPEIYIKDKKWIYERTKDVLKQYRPIKERLLKIKSK